MLDRFQLHNLFREDLKTFLSQDPQLKKLAEFVFQSHDLWWLSFDLSIPGIYILTGGRQIGKSTSCKQLIADCLQSKKFSKEQIYYLPCDEIFDAKEFSQILRNILSTQLTSKFLLIIDEVTYVKDWDRVIKALADEGHFTRGICLLTGSDSSILKEAAQRFPGRRGNAPQTDFHVHPLSFYQYVNLVQPNKSHTKTLSELFHQYLQTGGYLRAINDFASHGKILEATYQTYQQWIRGDILKRGKSDHTLLAIIRELLILGVSPISYSSLTQKMGLISKDTCIEYLNTLERMDIVMYLQAYDQNKKSGFPKKDRKFHFMDPFIQRTVAHWLHQEGMFTQELNQSYMVEACVASHCARLGKVFYFKGQGEVDVILLQESKVEAIEVKWTEQSRPMDMNALKNFRHAIVLTKHDHTMTSEGVQHRSVYEFLYDLTASESRSLAETS